ncbi:MAG: roadblock/LC7 domain-containing protein [Bryobacterales bacterium]|nr:roadblock/LC7 domain-containing protein [Bryobacterales bacterium]
MEAAIHQRIQGPLEELSLATRGIRGCLLATADGVAVLHQNLDAQAESLAALSASALGIGRKVSDVGDCGPLEEICFKGLEGWISVVAVGNRAVLATVAYEGCSIGMVMYYSRKYADEILAIIDPEQARQREEREQEGEEEEVGSMRSALRALAALDVPAMEIEEHAELP